MPTANEPYTIEQDGWTVRVKRPEEDSQPRAILLLHGWTGDENVMWIFTRKLPANYWMFAPRGPVQAGEGYAWLPHAGSLPGLDEFTAPAQTLMEAFDSWAEREGAPAQEFDVMGFSQGAAMAYALAARYPQRVKRVMALAGFMPRVEDDAPYRVLHGKHIYIAHGEQDEIIPVQLAEAAVKTLQGHGAQVTYCASETGHKLSASCLRGLEEYIHGR